GIRLGEAKIRLRLGPRIVARDQREADHLRERIGLESARRCEGTGESKRGQIRSHSSVLFSIAISAIVHPVGACGFALVRSSARRIGARSTGASQKTP